MEDVSVLLAWLDVDRPGLEKVRAAQGEPARAAAELLAYFRGRTPVEHPAPRSRMRKGGSTKVSDDVLTIAEDALRNVLIACSHYPRHAFGAEIAWMTNFAPTGDDEWLWHLHRHASWGALAAAWDRTGDIRFAEGYVRQLSDWIAKCPQDDRSPAWRTIEAGLRGRAWSEHFVRFLNAPVYTAEVLVRHLASFHDHARVLDEILKIRTHSNWGLIEAEGLAYIAVTFPEFREADAWRRRALDYVKREITGQVRPDGHQWEQCLGYHLGAIHWFSSVADLIAQNGYPDGVPSDYGRRLEVMCEAPLKLGFPDGGNAQFGDDSGPRHWRRLLMNWGRRLRREDFLWAGSGGREGRPPTETAFALPDSGFYSMRSGWDESATMLVLKCGPDGGWHCQPDNGAFEIFAGGRRLTPDSGTYIYRGNEQAERDRAWFRQTRVHPTLTLGGADTAYAPKLRLWKPGPELDTLVVENAGYPNLTHRRSVFFVRKRFFVVVDEALGYAEGDAWLHFQLAPAPGDAVLDAESLTARTGFPDGMNLLIRTMPRPGLQLVREEGRVSFEYAHQQPRPAFRYEIRKGGGPLRFVTVLAPFEGRPPEVGDFSESPSEPGADALYVEVTVGGERYRVGREKMD